MQRCQGRALPPSTLETSGRCRPHWGSRGPHRRGAARFVGGTEGGLLVKMPMQVLLRGTAPPSVTLHCDTKNGKSFQNREPCLKEGKDPCDPENRREPGSQRVEAVGPRLLLRQDAGCCPGGDGTRRAARSWDRSPVPWGRAFRCIRGKAAASVTMATSQIYPKRCGLLQVLGLRNWDSAAGRGGSKGGPLPGG